MDGDPNSLHTSIWHYSTGVTMAKTTLKQLSEKSKVTFNPIEAKPKDKPESKYTSTDYMKILSALGYQFKLCTLDDRVEVNGEPITDAKISEINSKVRDLGLTHIQVLADHYTRYAGENSYHPIKDYFNSLSWDKRDHIFRLSKYFSDTDNIFGMVLKRWLIGAVSKAFTSSQNPMLVLNSEKQGIGKSTFASWLCSFQPSRFIESSIDPNNKENEIRLMTLFVWEVSELGATTRKADVEALKAFITRQQVTVRKPYGHFDITKPALANLIGTINSIGGYLNDPSGNRRFMTVNLTAIDHAYQKEMDINQIWAQAYALYKCGDSPQPTKKEQEKIFSVNESFEIENPLVDLLKQNFKISPGNQQYSLATTEIIKILRADGWKGAPNETAEAMLISRAATKLNLQRRLNPTRGWIGITYKKP
jgi:predicted P-loop ATPase